MSHGLEELKYQHFNNLKLILDYFNLRTICLNFFPVKAIINYLVKRYYTWQTMLLIHNSLGTGDQRNINNKN